MTRRTWIAALPILVAMSGSAVRSQEKPIAIVGGRLIDGTGAPPFGRARPPISCCSTPIRPWTSTTRSKSGA